MVATQIFGRRGYELASIREIAVEAGVRNAALHYYFESKAQLYYACLDMVTKTIASRVESVLERARRSLADNPDLDGLIETYCLIQDCLIESFFAPDEGVSIGMLLAWADDLEETKPARDLMRDRVNLRIYAVISQIVGRILRKPPSDLATGLHAFAASGIYMIFHLDQTRIRDATGWSDPNQAEVEDLKKLVRLQSEILLRGLRAVSA